MTVHSLPNVSCSMITRVIIRMILTTTLDMQRVDLILRKLQQNGYQRKSTVKSKRDLSTEASKTHLAIAYQHQMVQNIHWLILLLMKKPEKMLGLIITRTFILMENLLVMAYLPARAHIQLAKESQGR